MSSAISGNNINVICDSLRVLLERDRVRYIESILTTHVCKQPPDYEAGLRLLLQLNGMCCRSLQADLLIS